MTRREAAKIMMEMSDALYKAGCALSVSGDEAVQDSIMWSEQAFDEVQRIKEYLRRTAMRSPRGVPSHLA